MGSLIYSTILAGDSGVGKTTIAHQYCHHSLPPTYPTHVTTIDRDFFLKRLREQGKDRTLQISDISGRGSSREHVRTFFHSAVIVVVIFDLTNNSSFLHAEEWCHEARSELPHNMATLVVLAGNKKDIVHRRAVPYHRAVEMARAHGMAYFEVSALDIESLDRVFSYVLKEYCIQEQYARPRTISTTHGSTTGFQQCTIMLLGDSNVGKTALFCRYFDETDSPNHLESLHHTYRTRIITLDNKRTLLKVWDTSVRNVDNLLTSQQTTNCCYVVIFDSTDRSTFTQLSKWIKNVTQHCSLSLQQRSKPAILLVGNKCDSTKSRTVTYEEARSYAKSSGASYVEVSAKYATNLEYCIVMGTFLTLQRK